MFGRALEIRRSGGGGDAVHSGAEGEGRIVRDIRIPAAVVASDLTNDLFDVCREWATPGNPVSGSRARGRIRPAAPCRSPGVNPWKQGIPRGGRS